MRAKLRTRLFEIARQLGWSDAEIARRTRLSPSHISLLSRGLRACGPDAIEGIRAALPQYSFEELFYVEQPSSNGSEAA